MSEIMAASQEQSAGIEQVKRISQMDQVTQQNAALVEAAAAEESPQAGRSAQAVSVFKKLDGLKGGGIAHSGVRKAPAKRQAVAASDPKKITNKPRAAGQMIWKSFNFGI